jgi:NAD+ synthase (glutamine-hydrolysing)
MIDVFDEKRYFKPARENQVFELDDLKLGINICEDIWVDNGPTDVQAKKGADFIVNISASPFYAGKGRERRELIARRARENSLPIVYVNLVGGQDDLVFDGGSCIFNKNGALIAKGKRFEEELVLTKLDGPAIIPEKEDTLQEIYNALVLGIRDYVRKNGFEKVVIGLSGGIDSALTATLATEALGSQNVIGVSMPSSITSQSSKEDAKRIAENLGIEFKVIPIVDAVDTYTAMLSAVLEGTEPDVTEENIQARIRGNILMALSNKFGYLVLSTGNKSELAVGYCTLYGDMSGGLAAISDVPKTTVYELSRYINTIKGREIIQQSIMGKEPSAELTEGQKDTDALPPYEILDPLLHAYIEEEKSREEIIRMGFDEDTVNDVIWKVDHNEYKRHQAPIGIKITPKAFGFGRRMPITNKYSG